MSCNKTTDATASSDKAITAFSFDSPAAVGTIDESAKTIRLSVPSGTKVSALAATFTVSAGASVAVGSNAQTSGSTVNDFTKPVTYTVTAADGSTAGYVVTVTVTAAKSSVKDITSFAFLAADNPGKLGADASGTIYDTMHVVYVSLPAGSSVLGLKPRVAISDGATVSPANLAATDFPSAITYTVTAADGSTKAYVVGAIAQPTAPEMLTNGDFSYNYSFEGKSQTASWYYLVRSGATSSVDFSSNAYVLSGSPRGSDEWAICLAQENLDFVQYGIYQLEFDARSTNPSDVIAAGLMEEGVDINGDGNAYTTWSDVDVPLSTATTRYSTQLIMRDYDNPKGVLQFRLGGSRTSGTVTIDKVSLKPNGTYTPLDGNLVWNGDFGFGQNFWTYWSDTAKGSTARPAFIGGKFSLASAGRGTESSDWQLQSNDKFLTQGTTFTISFDASSTASDDIIRVTLCEGGVDVNGDGNAYGDWGNYSGISLGTTTQHYSFPLKMSDDYADPNGRLIFQLGKTTGTITIDNVSMIPPT
jgi:hypothetical protein